MREPRPRPQPASPRAGAALAAAAGARGVCGSRPRRSRRARAQDACSSNGLTVLTLEDRTTPVVSFQIWVHVGSRDETRYTGLAHLFEHMMFKGSKHIGPEQHARLIEARGGEVNAYTSNDFTVYFERRDARDAAARDRARGRADREPRHQREDARQRAPGGARGAAPAQRGRPRGARLRGADGARVHRASLPHAGDRLAQRRRGGHGRGLPRVSSTPTTCRTTCGSRSSATSTPSRRWRTSAAPSAISPPVDPIPRNPTLEPEQRGERRQIVHVDVRSPLLAGAWHAPAAGHAGRRAARRRQPDPVGRPLEPALPPPRLRGAEGAGGGGRLLGAERRRPLLRLRLRASRREDRGGRAPVPGRDRAAARPAGEPGRAREGQATARGLPRERARHQPRARLPDRARDRHLRPGAPARGAARRDRARDRGRRAARGADLSDRRPAQPGARGGSARREEREALLSRRSRTMESGCCCRCSRRSPAPARPSGSSRRRP